MNALTRQFALQGSAIGQYDGYHGELAIAHAYAALSHLLLELQMKFLEGLRPYLATAFRLNHQKMRGHDGFKLRPKLPHQCALHFLSSHGLKRLIQLLDFAKVAGESR